MIKTIIATLILLTFPIFSHADGGILEGISIGSSVSVNTQTDADISTSSGSVDTTTINNQGNNTSANITSDTEVEVKSDGFFRRVINWFKGLFD